MNWKRTTVVSSLALLLCVAAITNTAAAYNLPNPQLFFAGTENYQANGQQWVKYNLRVVNLSAYPQFMFDPAPYLPACGSNANSSRTWVDIHQARTGQRLYGFCALGSPQDLDNLWFAVKQGGHPPRYVYIVMTDRRAKKSYKSNVVATH